MMNNIRNRADVSHYSLLLIILLLAWAVFSHLPHNILSWDIFGYYLYLPFTFIYNDIGLRNFETLQHILDQYQNTQWFYQALPQAGGHWVMKYPMGMAFLYLPWFVIGHLWALFSNFPADGFSTPYQLSLLYGSFVYTLVGLIYFRKSLRRFFNPAVSSIVMAAIVFGTNFMVLTVFHGQGLMSHNYLFFLFSLLLWNTICWHKNPSWFRSVAIGLIVGISALSRSTEILVAAIPLLWGVADKKSLMEKRELLKRHWPKIALMIVIVGSVGSLQLFYYRAMTGKFLFNSYGANAGEGMEFLHPYILEVLFSFRKGWLVYTPLMGLALIGFASLYRNKRGLFWAFLLFFMVSFYVIASWSCWWYADSYSQRSVIPMYVFLAFPLGYLISDLYKKSLLSKVLTTLLLAVLIGFNLFQSWQFLRGIIHSSRMTKPYYEAVLLKTSVPHGAERLLLIDRTKTPEQLLSEAGFDETPIMIQDFEADLTSVVAPDGSKAAKLDAANPFSKAIDLVYNDRLKVQEYGILKIRALIYCENPPETNPSSLTACFMHKNYPYNYINKKIEGYDFPLHQWAESELNYLIPEVRRPSDVFRFAIYHTGEQPVWVKKVEIILCRPQAAK